MKKIIIKLKPLINAKLKWFKIPKKKKKKFKKIKNLIKVTKLEPKKLEISNENYVY